MSQDFAGPAPDSGGQAPPPVPPGAYVPYGAYPVYYQPYRPTNGMAIAALVCALTIAPLGIVFGHVARAQIRRTGEGGDGLALAGLILGYIFTALMVIYVVVVAGFVVGVIEILRS
ncbi:MAG: DUF4190 domain-containing protein [Bifidobacteriaceae bacterium]|nr:DUF4190 domain-containing protein [Bifidobacteriaceae bacterium]